jgi:hypothetical protein
MAISRTEINIVSNDTDYQVPGDMTVQGFINGYSTQIQGLSNMVGTDRVETRDGGVQVRVLTFTPRQGTKG